MRDDMAVQPRIITVRRRERLFYIGMFTAWVLLFLVQTTLVAARRTDVHQRLMIAGMPAWLAFAGWLTR